jgi:hypothetical protein
MRVIEPLTLWRFSNGYIHCILLVSEVAGWFDCKQQMLFLNIFRFQYTYVIHLHRFRVGVF